MAPGPSSITTSDNLWCLPVASAVNQPCLQVFLVESPKMPALFPLYQATISSGVLQSRRVISTSELGRPPCPRRPSASSSDGSFKNKPRVRFIFEPESAPRPMASPTPGSSTTPTTAKREAATATRAFWLPFAYRHSGDYSEAELRDPAQQSIWQMEAQIQHLREEFDLGLARPSTTELVGGNQFGAFTDRVRHCTWYSL